MMPALREVTSSAAEELRRSFRALVATDLLYQLAAFALLTPLVSFGVRSLISLSGSAVLADQDILAFALGPVDQAPEGDAGREREDGERSLNRPG
jgi:hypothetical protein